MQGPNATASISGNDEKSEKPHKYVKPRIGSQFQVDILPYAPPADNTLPSSSETETSRSERAAPVVRAAPPLKKRGRPPKNKFVSRINSMDSLVSKGSGTESQRSSSLPINPLSSPSGNIPNRGGVCIHRPIHFKPENEKINANICKQQTISSYEQYLVFARNLMLQMPRKSTHTSKRADYQWKEAIASKALGEPDNYNSSTGSSRRGRKRKMELPDDDDMAWGLLSAKSENVSPSLINEKTPQKSLLVNHEPTSKLLGLENDEQMLEYLQVKHGGNINRAQLITLSQLSMGQADKARRYQLKKKKEEDENGGPLAAVFAPFSISWHRRYDMITSTMYGDARRRPGVLKYLYYNIEESCDGSHGLFPWMHSSQTIENKLNNSKETNDRIKQTDSKSLSKEPNSNVNELDEDLTKQWRSLLEYGQMFIKKIEKKETPPPALGDILLLIGKAYSMKKPEDVFGKRDSTPKYISICMNSLMDHVETSRKLLSNLIDSLHDANGEGLEIDSLTKKVNEMKKNTKLYLHELDTVNKMLKDSSRWESKLSSLGSADDSDESSMSADLNQPQESLNAVEKLTQEASGLVLRPKSLVLLEERIKRASDLRSRIRRWKKETSDQSENVKFISSMIKEANKISLSFPELSILSRLHKNTEEWIDRATIAIRSKISLNELEELIEKGEKMPVDVSDLLDKLRSRAKLAIDWINRLKIEVPGPGNGNKKGRNDVQTAHRSEWFSRMRQTFNDGSDDQIRSLMELASNGVRIPVEIECLHLLQSAVEFRNWSLKAKRWVPLPSGEPPRRGKIEDINDHLRVANITRNKVQMGSGESDHWKLDFEDDLKMIVQKANEWNEKYREYLEGDNRKAQGRCRVSFKTLQKIVEEAEEIPANLGNASIKMNRILSQANTWVEENYGVLQKCGIKINYTPTNEHNLNAKPSKFSMEEVDEAVENANKNLSVDLDEVQELQDVATRAQSWYDRALMFAPKRSKRNVRVKKVTQRKHDLDEIVSLIDEAASLPVDTMEDLERLKMQLSDIQSWRLQAQCDIKSIVDAFAVLKAERIAFYGVPSKFDDIVPSLRNINRSPASLVQLILTGEKNSSSLSNDNVTELSERNSTLKIPGGGKAVYKLISNFLKASKAMIFRTVEENIAEQLDVFGSWCKKAATIIASPNDIYTDKKWIKDLEKLVDDGGKMIEQCLTLEGIDRDQFDDESLLRDLFHLASTVISDDKTRLMVLRSRRDEFDSWCKKIEGIFSDPEKKISLEALQDLNKECLIFPSSVETVKQIQKELQAIASFSKSTKSLLKSGKKISIDEAKKLVSDGEKLKVACQEYKSIKNALRVARAWQKRVKACCSDQVSTQISEITALIDEHDTFTISMPDDIANLKQTMCNYCICRRPYDGFMIGCDECEEWYHGQCIGISESQAEKFDKFVCVRCCLKKVYNNTSQTAGCLIKKWSNDNEVSKARQNEYQKHHRKEKRDLREKGKILKEIDECKRKLGLSNETTDAMTQHQVLSETSGDKSEVKVNCTVKDTDQNEQTQFLENDSADGSAVSKDNVSSNEQSGSIEYKGIENNSKDAANTKLSKATASLDNCNRRLERLNVACEGRKALEQKENSLLPYLREWFLLVKSNVFLPDSDSDLSSNFPSLDGSLSSSMLSMVVKAKQFGINNLPDVSSMINAFKCLSWCLNALSILRRKPRLKEINSLLSQSDNIQFPEEKGVRMLRSMVQRANIWQSKVTKALISIPGESKNFDLELLHQLRIQLKDIPMIMPEEQLILNCLEDGGIRYCLCGGPSDGGFMLSCDKCDKWFHGTCVHLDKDTGDKLSKWICPRCENTYDAIIYKETVNKIVEERKKGYWRFLDYVYDVKIEDASPNAPDPNKLWPPFGKADSKEAVEIFGDTLSIQAGNTILPSNINQESLSTSQKLPLAKRLVRTAEMVNEFESEFIRRSDQPQLVTDTHGPVQNETNVIRHEPSSTSNIMHTNIHSFATCQTSENSSVLPQGRIHPEHTRVDTNRNNEPNPVYAQIPSNTSLNHSHLPQSLERSSNSPTPMSTICTEPHQPLRNNAPKLEISGRILSQPKLSYNPMMSNNMSIPQQNSFNKPMNPPGVGSNTNYMLSNNPAPHQSFHNSQHIVRVNQARLPPLGPSAEYSNAPYTTHMNQNQFTQQDPSEYTYGQQNMTYHQNGISPNSSRRTDLQYQNPTALNTPNILSNNLSGHNGVKYPINQTNSYTSVENSTRQIPASNIDRQPQIIHAKGNPSYATSRNGSENINVNQSFVDRNKNPMNTNQNIVNKNSSPLQQNESYLQRRFSPIQTNIEPNNGAPNHGDSTTPQSSLSNSNMNYRVEERRSPHPPQNFPQAGYQRGLDTLHYAANGVNSSTRTISGEKGDQLFKVGPNEQPYG